jgi:hypothetical protein
LSDGDDAFAVFARVSGLAAFGALLRFEDATVLAFGDFGLDFLATGRAGDRLAAPRRCFAMQCWPASFGP